MSQESEDHVAIAAAAASYSAAANRMSGREMEAVLTPDAVLGGVARAVGRDYDDVVGARAIGDIFAEAFEKMELIHQIPHVADIKIDGDRATATTMIVEYLRPKGAPLMLMLANYHDTLVRTKAGWKFSRRMFVTKSMTPLA